MNHKKEILLNILRIVLVAAITVAVLLNYNTLSNLDIRTLISEAKNLSAAIVIILGIYCIKSVSMVIPASMVYISVGVAMDWKTAILVNMLGIALEVIIAYFFGKFLGKDAVQKKLSATKKGEKLIGMLDKNQNLAIFLIRLIPAFPIDISSLFMGAFNFSFPTYLLLSLIGIAPRVIAFTVLGESIYNLIPMKYIIIIGVSALIIFTVSMVIKSLVKKIRTQTLQK